jgi:hypothetical protein
MISRPPLRSTARQALFVHGAIALPVLLYFASASWLQRESPRMIRSATRYELVKAFVCAGLAVDLLFVGRVAMSHIPYPT